MKIKITKCSNANLWYNDRIGEIFNVSDEDPVIEDHYEVHLKGVLSGLVDFDDCEIFECS